MAKTVDNLMTMVSVTPYEHDGMTFDALNVCVTYRKGTGFVVWYQPVKRTEYGYQTGPMPCDDPLVKNTSVTVEKASKNSEKKLRQMMANIEVGQEAIAWLFDHREWEKLVRATGNIARSGYPEPLKKKMHDLMAQSESSAESKEDVSPMMKQYRDLKAKHPDALLLFRCGDFYETYCDDAVAAAQILGITLTKRNNGAGVKGDEMAGFPHHALDTYLPKLIRAGKRVAICEQLEDPKLTKKLVKRGITELLQTATKNNNEISEDTTMKKNNNETNNVQTAQVNNDAIESVNVGEVSLDDIKPTMIVAEEPKAPTKTDVAAAISKAANDGKATTIPLGSHGELVIAKPKVTLKRKTNQLDTATESKLPVVSLVTFTTKRGDTAPRIIGFYGEDDPRWKKHYDNRIALAKAAKAAKAKDPKAKTQSDPFGASWMTDRTTGVTYTLTFGVRYMDVAKALCEAYNTNDRAAWAKAEQAVIDLKAGIVAGYQAEKAARKAEREAKKSGQPAAPAMSADEQEMFDLFKKFMAGDKEAMAKVGAVLNKAA